MVLFRKEANYKLLSILFLGVLLVLGILFLVNNSLITGNTISLDKEHYLLNQPINGEYILSLKEGELIPEDSIVKIEYSNFSKEYSMKDFIELTDSNIDEDYGDYYVENAKLSGEGFGFGKPGESIRYPEIYFKFRILDLNETIGANETQANETEINETEINETIEISEENITDEIEENATEEPEQPITEENNTQEEPGEQPTEEPTEIPAIPEIPEENPTENPVETPEEQPVENPSEPTTGTGEVTETGEGETGEGGETGTESQEQSSEESESQSQQPDQITGNFLTFFAVANKFIGIWNGFSISEFNGEYLSASVSKDSPFYYTLEPNEELEIIGDSVDDGNESLSQNVLDLKKNGDKIKITTDYSKKEFGFGEDYLGGVENYNFNLNNLNISINETGEYSIKVSVLSSEKIIDEEKVDFIVTDKPKIKMINRKGQTIQEIQLNDTQAELEIGREKVGNKQVYKIKEINNEPAQNFLTGNVILEQELPEINLDFSELPSDLVIQIDKPTVSLQNSGIGTEIIAIESESNQNFSLGLSTITLEKTIGTEIKNIIYCDDWNIDNFNCNNGWMDSGLIFIDNGTSVSFNVTHFTAYAGNYTGTSNTTNLMIWDDSDNIKVYPNENNSFYANYTNSTSKESINGTNIWCEFRENSSGSWSAVVNLTFNDTSRIYELSKNITNQGVFYFNVSCFNAIGYSNLSILDIFRMSSNESGCIGANYNFTCGDTINESCIMNGNITCDGTGFYIGENDVMVDCNNYTISYSYSLWANGSGINITTRNNTIIKKCIIRLINQQNFAPGISIGVNAINNTIQENNIYIPTGSQPDSAHSIYIYGSSNNNTLKDNYLNVLGWGAGINITSSNYNNVSNNTIMSNSQGAIRIRNANYNIFSNNHITSTNVAIDIYSSSNNLLDKNNVTSSNLPIYVQTSSNNNTINNSIFNRTGAGDTPTIGIDFSSDNVINNNTLYSTAGTTTGYNLMIYGATSRRNVITNNRIFNGFRGARVYGYSADSIIRNNTILNTTYGLEFEDVMNNTLQENQINNTRYGIYIQSSFSFIFDANYSIDTTNLINGLPIYYYNHVDGQTIDCTSLNQNALQNTNATAGVIGIITIANSQNVILRNCDIRNQDSTGNGISLLRSSGINLENITSINNQNAVFIGRTNNSNISGLAHTGFGGIFLTNSFGNLIKDSSIISSNNYSIHSYNINSNNTFLNVSFNKSNVNLNNGAIYVKWYLDSYVNYTNGTIADGAFVTGYNNANALIFNSTTNSSGYILRQNLTEYIQNTTGKTFYTNYSVNSTKGAYSSIQTRIVNLTENYIIEQNGPINLSLSPPILEGCIGATTNFTCGDSITESCIMNADLNTTGNCFVIGADSVIIDGNGFTILGPDGAGTGITSTGRTNITIKNFNIQQFNYGIYLDSCSNSKLDNNFINYSQFSGISIHSSDYINASENTIMQILNRAMEFYETNDSNISYNNLSNGNNFGIFISDNSQNNILNNNLVNLNNYGIYFDSSAIGNTLDSNYACSNSLDYWDSDSNTETNTTCDSSTPTGICDTYCDGNISGKCIGATYNFTCGETINESCNLIENATSIGNCFTIGASDIVIDGAGYTLNGDGTGSAIIPQNGLSNVTIQNFNLVDFNIGVYESDLENSTIQNFNISTSGFGYGVQLQEDENTRVINNRFTNLAVGFGCYNSINLTLQNNLALGCHQGGFSITAENSLFADNNATNGWDSFFQVGGFNINGQYNQFLRNRAENNTDIGFYSSSATSHNLFENNTAINNGHSGFYHAFSSTNNTFINNNASNNINYGIFMPWDSSNYNLTDNYLCFNGILDYWTDNETNIETNTTCDTSTPGGSCDHACMFRGCVGENYNFTCGDAINESCIMISNLNCSDSAFYINASNILIDGKGYTLQGVDGIDQFGILDQNPTQSHNITIKNFIIRDFFQAIRFNGPGTTESTIFNNTIISCSFEGIHFGNSTYSNISYNAISDTSDWHGIYLPGGSDNNLVENNVITNNAQSGIKISDGCGGGCLSSDNNYIYNNTISGSGEAGIRIEYEGCHNNTLIGNYLSGNNDGISLEDADLNNILVNNITGNYNNGLVFSSTSTDNNASNNFICFNSNDVWDDDTTSFDNTTCDTSSPGGICDLFCTLPTVIVNQINPGDYTNSTEFTQNFSCNISTTTADIQKLEVSVYNSTGQLVLGNLTNVTGIIWSETFNDEDISYVENIAKDNEGNLLVIGYIDAGPSYYRALLLKYAPNGTLLWSDKFNVTEDHNYGEAIVVDGDNNFYVTGMATTGPIGNQDIFVRKYYANETLAWEQINGMSGSFAEARAISLDSANNIIIGAEISQGNPSGYDPWILKYDNDGNLLWDTLLEQDYDQFISGASVDSDNNIYATGTAYNDVGYTDILFIKLDSDGISLWNNTYDYSGNYDDASGLIKDSLNNFYLTGYVNVCGEGCSQYLWTAKYDSDGNQIWENIDYGGSGYAYGSSITLDDYGNVYSGGYSDIEDWAGDAILIKYDNDGNFISSNNFGEPEMYDDGYGVIVDSENKTYFAGYTTSYGLGQDAWIFKAGLHEITIPLTTELSGTINETFWLETLLYDDTYLWGCKGYDVLDNTAETGNRTLIISTLAPLSPNCQGATQTFVCGDTITESCTINSDLNCSGEGFTIGADNLVVDCNNYILTGNGSGNGFNILDYNNITLKNCQIKSFYSGIFFNSSNSSLIYNNSFDLNKKAGIFTINSNNNNITKNYNTNTSASCTYQGNQHCNYSNPNDESGIALCNSSSNNWIEQFTLYGLNTGLGECGVDAGITMKTGCLNNTIYNITLHYPDTYGILIFDTIPSHNTNISYYFLYGANAVGKSTNDGIIQSGFTQNLTVKNSYMENTSEWGPFLDISINAYLDNVTVKNANGVGIRLTTNSTNPVIKNSFVEGSPVGIYMPSTSNVTIFNTLLNNISDYGISLTGGNNILTNFSRNNITNSDVGVFLGSSNNIISDENLIFTNNNYSFYVSGSNNTLQNQKINETLVKDIFATIGDLILLNCTFNKSKIQAGDSAKIYVEWYLDAKVISSAGGGAVANANVTAYTNQTTTSGEYNFSEEDSVYYSYNDGVNPFSTTSGTWVVIGGADKELNGYDAERGIAYLNNGSHYDSPYKRVESIVNMVNGTGEVNRVMAVIDLQDPGTGSQRYYSCNLMYSPEVPGWSIQLNRCDAGTCGSSDPGRMINSSDYAEGYFSFDTDYSAYFERNGSDFICDIEGEEVSGSDSTWTEGYEGLGIERSSANVSGIFDNTTIAWYKKLASTTTQQIEFSVLTNSSGYILRQNVTEYYLKSYGSENYHTNYSVTGSKTGMISAIMPLNITRNYLGSEFTLPLGVNQPPQGHECGDGDCNGDETCSSCEKDCGLCYTCGNGKCESSDGETSQNCQQDCCATEGEQTSIGNCCSPLKALTYYDMNAAPDNNTCPGASKSFVCGNCGNGICGVGENACNCPDDCKVIVCAKEGELSIGNLSCCSGLTKIPNTIPSPISETGCLGSIVLGSGRCTYCGDGKCGLGENECNCFQDCPCGKQGETVGVNKPCCAGLTKLTLFTKPETCSGLPESLWVCGKCGNGKCEAGENPCNCLDDCAGNLTWAVRINGTINCSNLNFSALPITFRLDEDTERIYANLEDVTTSAVGNYQGADYTIRLLNQLRVIISQTIDPINSFNISNAPPVNPSGNPITGQVIGQEQPVTINGTGEISIDDDTTRNISFFRAARPYEFYFVTAEPCKPTCNNNGRLEDCNGAEILNQRIYCDTFTDRRDTNIEGTLADIRCSITKNQEGWYLIFSDGTVKRVTEGKCAGLTKICESDSGTKVKFKQRIMKSNSATRNTNINWVVAPIIPGVSSASGLLTSGQEKIDYIAEWIPGQQISEGAAFGKRIVQLDPNTGEPILAPGRYPRTGLPTLQPGELAPSSLDSYDYGQTDPRQFILNARRNSQLGENNLLTAFAVAPNPITVPIPIIIPTPTQTVVTGDFPLTPGKPYFVSFNKNSGDYYNLIYFGDIPAPVTFEFKKTNEVDNVNYLVLPLNTTIKKASQLCDLGFSGIPISGGDYIVYWDPISQDYLSSYSTCDDYVGGFDEMDLMPGIVYLIKVTQDKTWTQK